MAYKQEQVTPEMTELGYMAQAAATLRRSEYTALLINWLDENLTNARNFEDKGAPWHLKSEFCLAQTLMAIAQLSAGDPLCMEIIKLAKIEQKVEPIIAKLARSQLVEDGGNEVSYGTLVTPLLWASVALDFTSVLKAESFSDRAVQMSLRTQDKIPFASKVLLSQAI